MLQYICPDCSDGTIIIKFTTLKFKWVRKLIFFIKNSRYAVGMDNSIYQISDDFKYHLFDIGFADHFCGNYHAKLLKFSDDIFDKWFPTFRYSTRFRTDLWFGQISQHQKCQKSLMKLIVLKQHQHCLMASNREFVCINYKYKYEYSTCCDDNLHDHQRHWVDYHLD